MVTIFRFLLVFGICTLVHSSGLTQDYFISNLNLPTIGTPSVTNTPNGGWMVYEPENSTIFKFDRCGTVEWAKQLQAKNEDCCVGNAMITLNNGNVALLQREAIGTSFGFRIIVLDVLGNVVWSKLYSRAGVDYYPYSMDIDIAGNLMAYVAEIPQGGGQGYRLVLKVNESGSVIWSKNYQTPSIWGASISASNGSSICRTGHTIFKINPNGSVDWAVSLQLPNTYDYYAPVEVADGFIISTKVSGTDELLFVKLDKSGALQWNEARNILNISATSNNLFGLPNGNFVTVLNPTNGTNPTLVEFDSDLQPQKTVRIGLTSSNLRILDLITNDADEVLVAGIQNGVVPSLMHGKLSSNYGGGCSINVSVNTGSLPVSSSVVNIPVQDVVVDEVTSTVTTNNIFYATNFICSQVVGKPINLGPDTVLCNDDSLELNTNSVVQYETYLWSTGETTPTITVKDSGTYYLTAKGFCDTSTYTDTINITKSEVPTPVNWQEFIDLCENENPVLDAEVPNGSYLWDNGSTAPQLTISQSGTYTVTITVGRCAQEFESVVSSCENLAIPNVFTPNADGINDYFSVVYDGNEDFQIEIYNRWGVKQFISSKAGFSWNGRTISGQLAPVGVYYYIITVGEEIHKGALTLTK